MKTKTENLLPKMLFGTVHTQFVRCGKPNCRCSAGELHGPYYYHFVRIDGKSLKRYLKPSEIEQTQTACSERQNQNRKRRDQSKAHMEQLRKIRSALRELTDFYEDQTA